MNTTVTAGAGVGSTEEQLTSLVGEIRRAIAELTGVYGGLGGRAVPVSRRARADPDRIAALAATALGVGRQVSERSSLGSFQETVVRGEDGYLVVYAPGRSAVLAITVISVPLLFWLRTRIFALRARSETAADVFALRHVSENGIRGAISMFVIDDEYGMGVHPRKQQRLDGL